jgi:hypothetical protein
MTHAAGNTASSTLECPRCGHLVGAMADEAERIGATHGTCSECGLPIEWRRLRADAVAPPWFVEARASRHNIVRRAFGTLMRLARPFRFWDSIDLALPISVRGLVAFLALLCIIAHLALALQRFLIDSPAGAMPPLPRAVAAAPTIGKATLALLWPYETIDGAEAVQLAHQRDGASELLPLLGDSAVVAMEAVWISIAYAPAPGRLAAPQPFNDVAVRWLRRGGAIQECDTLLPRGFAAPAFVAMTVASVTPLVMLLLPVSLRRARVQPRHFVRMFALGLALPLVVLLSALAASHAMRMFGYLGPSDPNYHLFMLGGFRDPFFTFLLLLLAAVLGAIWTAAAASRYLRLPNARAVGVCCGAIAWLTASVALFLL